jgi:hypothetical protein
LDPLVILDLRVIPVPREKLDQLVESELLVMKARQAPQEVEIRVRRDLPVRQDLPDQQALLDGLDLQERQDPRDLLERLDPQDLLDGQVLQERQDLLE